MMSIFFYLLRIELTLFARSRVALFWAFAFPLFMLVIQMALFGGGINLGTARVAIVDPARSADSIAFTRFIQGKLSSLHFLHVNIDVLAQPSGKKYDAEITLPRDLAEHIASKSVARIDYHVKDEQAPMGAALVGVLRGLVEGYSLEISGAHPLLVLSRDRPLSSAAGTAYNLYLVTGLTVMVMLSTSLMGFAVPLVAAREGGLFRLYQMFPLRPSVVLMTWLLARLITIVLSSIVLMTAAVIFYGVPVTLSAPELLFSIVLLILGAGAFLSVGILISTLAPNVPTATMICNLIYFPMLFTGNLIIPTGNLPGFVQAVLSYFPANAVAASLRHALGEQFDGRTDFTALAFLLASIVLFLAVAQRRFCWVPQE